jgi:short subunit dehydrogenase-like uncharacterized protein
MRMLIYGATGYVGSLLVAAAAERQIDAVVAGRSESVVEVAAAAGMEPRVGDVDNIVVDDVDVVVNAAGPFAHTAASLARRCVESGVHYVDLAGEAAEFEAVHAVHDSAVAAGVTLMPGVGFGVVPTDCLALHLKRRVPEGVSIDIGFATTGGVSGGTLRTLAAGFGDRGGVPGELLRTRQIDFKSGSKRCIENPWRGDLFTTPLSTGIDAVTTWISLPRPLAWSMAAAHRRGDPVRPPLPGRVLRQIASRAPAGPSAKKLARGHAEVWAQITDPSGAVSVSSLTTPDAYVHSIDAALESARRLAVGSPTAGFRTPAQEFGADFVTELPDVVRTDR